MLMQTEGLECRRAGRDTRLVRFVLALVIVAMDCADPAVGGQLDDHLGKTRRTGSLERVPW